jgi:hypothetical protein
MAMQTALRGGDELFHVTVADDERYGAHSPDGHEPADPDRGARPC